MNYVQKELFNLSDESYKNFHKKLIPTVSPNLIIGVRTPILRKFSKDFAKTKEAAEFISELPHKYYEENNVHAFVIETIKDYDTALVETNRFLPYIDNWATCDMFAPKVFKKNTDKLLTEIKKWIKSEHTYTVRFAIGLLMSLYLDDDFSTEFLELVSSVKSDEYYINMMIAWYFATALTKQYKASAYIITEQRLDKWVHNKTIQKACESYRITSETKEFLKTQKIK